MSLTLRGGRVIFSKGKFILEGNNTKQGGTSSKQPHGGFGSNAPSRCQEKVLLHLPSKEIPFVEEPKVVYQDEKDNTILQKIPGTIVT